MQNVRPIGQTKERLGATFCENILFMHAILGYDTAFRLFGLGKGRVLKVLNDEQFRHNAAVFNYARSNKNELNVAGEHAIIALYGGGDIDSLDSLRCFITKLLIVHLMSNHRT